jgi:UPF0176 protein
MRDMTSITVAALYRFTRFEDPESLRAPLAKVCRDNGVRGTLILAREGVNGTIAGTREGVDAALGAIRSLPGCAGLDVKESVADAPPFRKMKVRLKAEIVTMGRPDVDPTARVGVHVDPGDWNHLIRSDSVVVIDTRNAYEVGIGTFSGAVDPGTGSFREFPDWWRANAERFAGRPVAMFCTGGIRCEKASNFLLGEGVGEVYHLKGGILKYLEEVPEAESLWEGECYVFDRRVSVGHGLEPGVHTLCHACGRPFPPEATDDPAYERGVSCPACVEEYDEVRRAGFRQRQRQIDRATERAGDGVRTCRGGGR